MVTPMAELPVPPPSTAKLRAADLQLLEEDARRFVVRDRPATDALWLTLLKPSGVVLRDYRALLTAWADGAPEANAGLLDPMGRPVGQGAPAIQAWATATVAKAMLGDLAAGQQIADRIEGRPAQRKLDETEAAESRAVMISGIEALVRSMNAHKPGDGALDVTPKAAFDKPKANGKGNGHDEAPPSDEPGGPGEG
jgi:hypothetical protein